MLLVRKRSIFTSTHSQPSIHIYICMYMYIYIQSCSVRSSVLCLSKEDRQVTHGNTVKCKGITFFGTQFYSAAFAFTLQKMPISAFGYCPVCYGQLHCPQCKHKCNSIKQVQKPEHICNVLQSKVHPQVCENSRQKPYMEMSKEISCEAPQFRCNDQLVLVLQSRFLYILNLGI